MDGDSVVVEATNVEKYRRSMVRLVEPETGMRLHVVRLPGDQQNTHLNGSENVGQLPTLFQFIMEAYPAINPMDYVSNRPKDTYLSEGHRSTLRRVFGGAEGG